MAYLIGNKYAHHNKKIATQGVVENEICECSDIRKCQ